MLCIQNKISEDIKAWDACLWSNPCISIGRSAEEVTVDALQSISVTLLVLQLWDTAFSGKKENNIRMATELNQETNFVLPQLDWLL